MRKLLGFVGVALFLALIAGAAVIPLPSVSFHGGNLTCAFVEVRAANGTFEPASAYIYKNATVVWVNPGPGEHAICIGNEVSPPLLAGQSYTKNFHEFGQYNYSCRYHPGERGQVTVR